MGASASSTGTNDQQPVPGFDSPHVTEATVRFVPVDESGNALSAQLFVGRYEARATPVADTNPATALGDRFEIVPGTYDLLARANGRGTVRTSITVAPGEQRTLTVTMPRNLASRFNGATATGDGTNLTSLIEDTEATNWASLGTPVAGKQVTVRLDGSRTQWSVDSVQVSAMLRPPSPNDPGGDTGGQNRYSALRQFRILACRARAGVDCSQAYTSRSSSRAPRTPSPRCNRGPARLN
jgi:extracellular elastinolytic metalloproteinase